jgi:hypothetical protein
MVYRALCFMPFQKKTQISKLQSANSVRHFPAARSIFSQRRSNLNKPTQNDIMSIVFLQCRFGHPTDSYSENLKMSRTIFDKLAVQKNNVTCHHSPTAAKPTAERVLVVALLNRGTVYLHVCFSN